MIHFGAMGAYSADGNRAALMWPWSGGKTAGNAARSTATFSGTGPRTLSRPCRRKIPGNASTGNSPFRDSSATSSIRDGRF